MPISTTTPELFTDLKPAIGIVKIYPYKRGNHFIECAATHIGKGIVATSGHCFLGAKHCNGAIVTFPFSKSNNQPVRCESVIRIAADESRYQGLGKDVALFQIKAAPEAAAVLESDMADTEKIWVPNIGNTWLGPKVRSISNCRITSVTPVDVFKRPKSSSNFSFTCNETPIRAGTPLFSTTTKKLVGIYSAAAVSLVEPLVPGQVVPKVFFGQKASKFETSIAPLEDISVGNFSQDSFPMGIPTGLDMTIAQLNSTTGYLTFDVRNSLNAVVQVVDGDGARHIFQGQMTTNRKNRIYKTPLNVKLAVTASDYSAMIENLSEVVP